MSFLPLDVSLLFFVEEVVQLVFSSVSTGMILCVAVDLLGLWKKVNSSVFLGYGFLWERNSTSIIFHQQIYNLKVEC